MSFEKGRRFENYVKNKLKKLGYYVIRSAGSRGTFDLVAIKNGIAWGIQCKKGHISKKEVENIMEIGKKYGIIPCVASKKDKRVAVICLYSGKDILEVNNEVH